jgi:hypothetical protein
LLAFCVSKELGAPEDQPLIVEYALAVVAAPAAGVVVLVNAALASPITVRVEPEILTIRYELAPVVNLSPIFVVLGTVADSTTLHAFVNPVTVVVVTVLTVTESDVRDPIDKTTIVAGIY